MAENKTNLNFNEDKFDFGQTKENYNISYEAAHKENQQLLQIRR